LFSGRRPIDIGYSLSSFEGVLGSYEFILSAVTIPLLHRRIQSGTCVPFPDIAFRHSSPGALWPGYGNRWNASIISLRPSRSVYPASLDLILTA
jgi:hypothetical protein